MTIRKIPEFHAKSPLDEPGNAGSRELLLYLREIEAAMREIKADVEDHETRITALEP